MMMFVCYLRYWDSVLHSWGHWSESLTLFYILHSFTILKLAASLAALILRSQVYKRLIAACYVFCKHYVHVHCPSIHKSYTFSLSGGIITDLGVVALAEVLSKIVFLKWGYAMMIWLHSMLPGSCAYIDGIFSTTQAQLQFHQDGDYGSCSTDWK